MRPRDNADGVYITDATLIARRYATSFLALDVLSATTFEQFTETSCEALKR